MCDKPTTVSVRDLRDHLGDHINRVLVTQTPIVITDRGRPVARLTPLPTLDGDREVVERIERAASDAPSRQRRGRPRRND